MKKLLLTIKWEASKWFAHHRIFLISLVPCLIILFLLPVPGEEWNAVARDLVIVLHGIAGVPLVISLYMAWIYPTVSLLGFEVTKAAILGKSSGNSFAYIALVRTGINLATAGLGVVVLAATISALRPLAVLDIVWLSNVLTNAPTFPITFYSLLFTAIWLPTALLAALTVVRSRFYMKSWYHVFMYLGLFALGVFEGYWALGMPFESLIRLVASGVMMAWCCYITDRYADMEVTVI